MKPVQRPLNPSEAERNFRPTALGSATRQPTRGVALVARFGERRVRGRIGVWLGALVALAVTVSYVGLSSALADEPPVGFRLIANVANTASHVDREFVSDVFLKKATRWPGGDPIQPFDLRFDAPARRQFSSSMLRRSVAAVRSYWQQRIFSGRDVPPPEIDSDEAMIRRVQAHRGSIGYVSERAVTSSVRVIEVR